MEKSTPTSKDILSANAFFIGAAVGAGIFGLPYAVQKAGLIPSLILFVLVFLLVLLVHLMIAEIAVNSHIKHRVPGYVGEIMGPWARKTLVVANVIGITMGLLIYTIFAADFLKTILFSSLGQNPKVYAIVFFALSLPLILKGIGIIKKMENYLTLGMLLVIAMISYLSFTHYSFDAINNYDPKYAFIPYGVFLFAFTATAVIPEVTEMLKKNLAIIRSSLIASSLLIAFLYLAFALAVSGATGYGTTQDAITGLVGVLGKPIIYVGALAGFLAIISSYLPFGETLMDILALDLKLNNKIRIVFLLLPILLYLLGLTSFILIAAILGSVFFALEGGLIVLAHKKSSPAFKYRLLPRLPATLYYFVTGLLMIGVGSVMFITLT